MTATTLTIATTVANPNRTPPAPRTAARDRAAFAVAMQAWAECMIALDNAACAADALSDAMADVMPDQLDRHGCQNMEEDSFHIFWTIRQHIANLEGPCPPAVYQRVRGTIREARTTH